MSITAIKTPGRYTAAYGNIVYQVESTNQNTKFKFRYVFDVFMNSQKIARIKVTPQNTNWGQVDITRIIQNYMESAPINMGSSLQNEPISKAEWGWLNSDWLIYDVFVGEEYSTTETGEPILYNGIGSQGDPVFQPNGDDPRYVINAIKEWTDKDYNLSPFYLKTTSLPGPYEYNSDRRRFLTNAPRIQYVKPTDWGTLSALNFHFFPESLVSDPVYSAYFEFFDDNDILLTTGRTYNLITNGGWRFDCSGNTANQPLYPDFQNKMISYVGAYPQNLLINGVGLPPQAKYYRVSLEKSLDDAVPPSPTPSQTPQPTPSPSSSTVPPPTIPVGASVTPTPSITSTPTPTISITPTPSPSIYLCRGGCQEYGIYNYSSIFTLTVEYTDCYTGNIENIVVKQNDSELVCACGAPERVSGSTNFDINEEGDCR
jgi:hypothetical protein